MIRAIAIVLCSSLLGCGRLPPSERAANRDRCAWRVCVTTDDGPGGRDYQITNEEPVPATVVLTFRTVDNMVRPEGGKIELVIPAEGGDTVRVERLTGGPMTADLSIAIDLGSSATVPEDYLYASPFGGTSARPLIQGFDGDETHMGSMRYALDIAMPGDTPVFAARDGVVLYLQDGFTEGGTDPSYVQRANLVVIAHRDGTMASYGHLSRGLEVRRGDSVSVGDLIGWSGRTGYAGKPHLHFHVGVRLMGEPGRSIPVQLDDGRGRPLDLRDGMLIEPARMGPVRSYL
jgi:murein DD-endopeptidase MepM/ murein hydrolase activator NlpD